MEKHISGLFIAFSVLALVLVGLSGITGYNMGQGDKVIEEVEVIKNVEVPFPVEVPSASAYLDTAVLDFMNYVDDEELFECNDFEYDFDEISVNRVYNDYSVSFVDDEYIVNFEVKLEYDEYGERSCKRKFEVEAHYEDDEVEISA